MRFYSGIGDKSVVAESSGRDKRRAQKGRARRDRGEGARGRAAIEGSAIGAS